MRFPLVALLLVAVMSCTPSGNLTDTHIELIALTAIMAEKSETYTLIRVHNSGPSASGYEFYEGAGCGSILALSIPTVAPGATSDYASTSSTILSVQRVSGSFCQAFDPPLEPGPFRTLYDSGSQMRLLGNAE